jgi:SAM-dependent methyltransferase
MVKTDAVTTRLDLQVAKATPRRRNILRPSSVDLAMIALPRALWWGYYFLKPIRLARERIVGRSTPPPAWPFLGTPASLIPALLEAAEVGPTDLLVDLGCGDGRVLIEAATRCGCRALGIEKDPALAERARRLVAECPARERIEIFQGDGSQASLSEATVVFLFLPVGSIPGIVESLRTQLPAGARIVAHEQERMVFSREPDRSQPLFATDALTVAHSWRV